MATLLQDDGHLLTASQDEAYSFTIKISTSSIKFDEIVEWLKSRTKPV